MIEIGLGVALFTGIILCLVLMILAARSKLVTTGTVAITVNDGRTIEARIGDRLLGALAETGIHLPSACGGVGTCGQCRIEILQGGGTILPTEAAQITRREAAHGVRLACQVALRQDMTVRVPDEVFDVRQWDCTVRSNGNVATLIKELVLDLPQGQAMDFRAGSYVQIACPPYSANFADFDIESEFRDEWDRLDLWRCRAGAATSTTRAYSLANSPDEGGTITLVIRIAIPPPGAPETVPPGIVSSYLFSLKPGDTVSVSGPFGRFFAAETDNEMVFVGGGAGMAPMRSHILDQLKHLKSKRKITFWYGARSRRELFFERDFEQLQNAHENFQWSVALSAPRPEDEWHGKTGFIHDVLYDSYLKNHPAPEDCEYYLCGPPMMIKAVRNMLDNLGVDPDNIFSDDFGS
ncbi:MAG: NADH:ubiquinone reductase (Na(+)-transporting) subunit F [Rhodospirillales bacterium]|nr:NADH:ubiquinone reductase (Na(+)-transporting) subunit F [Rhodospirillales bacterium]